MFESIAYEDEEFFAVNKPSGMHSVAGRSGDTLAAWLKTLRSDLLGEEFEHGILQRLDFETQGLLLVAKNVSAYTKLKALFSSGAVQKVYLALVEGDFPVSASVAGFIGAKGRSAKKVAFTEKMPKHGRSLYAETRFQKVKYLPELNISLVRAETDKGRRHQIRVSAAHLGSPLVGDVLYGAKTSLPAGLAATGFYLLGYELSFVSPFSKKAIVIKSTIKPPPILKLKAW